MRVIYTYWSKSINPDLVENVKNIDIFLYYQTVSLFYLRNNLPSNYKIDIITDSFGKEIYEKNIPKLWDNIYVEMDEYNNYDINRWALVKVLKLFSLKPPFIHLDYDVIIKSDQLFKRLFSKSGINFLYQTVEPLTFHPSYMESFKKMKFLLKKYRLSPTIGYNAGFNYFNIDLSNIHSEILKYSKIKGNSFFEDMFLEQIIIPSMISEKYKLFTLNDLFEKNIDEIAYMKNSIPELDYSHYASSHVKEVNLEYIISEYKKIINDNVGV